MFFVSREPQELICTQLPSQQDMMSLLSVSIVPWVS